MLITGRNLKRAGGEAVPVMAMKSCVTPGASGAARGAHKHMWNDRDSDGCAELNCKHGPSMAGGC